MVKIGIFGGISSNPPNDKKFTSWEKIRERIDDPNSHFIFSDEYPIIARYLNQIQYRKCTVYHIGSAPKHNIGKYTNRGEFVSYAEINATIREECDELIIL